MSDSGNSELCRHHHHPKFRLWYSPAQVSFPMNSSYSLVRFLASSYFWLTHHSYEPYSRSASYTLNPTGVQVSIDFFSRHSQIRQSSLNDLDLKFYLNLFLNNSFINKQSRQKVTQTWVPPGFSS